MKRRVGIIWLVITMALVACLFSIPYLIPWSGKRTEIVHLQQGGAVAVNWRWKDKVDLDLLHITVINLFSGLTQLTLTSSDGTECRFSIREDLKLFAIHQVEERLYLVFVPDYLPQRGFIAYLKTSPDTLFREISVADLPIEASIPNLEPYLEEVHFLEMTGSEPPKEFYRTYTSWLWSQMATGRDHIGYNTDVVATNDAWQRAKASVKPSTLRKEQP